MLSAIVLALVSCEHVKDGITANYAESTATVSIELLTADRGAIGDTVSYAVKVSAKESIKSLFVATEVSGAEGSTFDVSNADTDPFIDHDYGTIQPGTYDIDLVYNYIVEQDTVNARLVFTLIDESGAKRDTQKVVTIPAITSYTDVALYAQSTMKADGFSTEDGTVYYNLPDYEELTVVNQAVQESLDLVFLVSDETAVLAAPYSSAFTSDMTEKNKTLFKIMSDVSSDDFYALTNATLSQLTEDQEVKKGTTQIEDVKVGDVIGFRTDYASTNSYNYGMLLVTALHPTVIDHYEGVSYVIEFDVTVQHD